MEAADTNHDGVIDYAEFIPVAIELMKASSESAQKDEAVGSVGNYSDADLENYLEQLFMIADENGDGVLQPSELDR